MLYFSDTRDAFALETEEERFQALSEKLKALDLQVADVDRQLDDLTHLLLEQRGLSLGLALAHSYPALAEQQLADKFALEAETHLSEWCTDV